MNQEQRTSIIFWFQALFYKQAHLVAGEQNKRASVQKYDAPSQEWVIGARDESRAGNINTVKVARLLGTGLACVWLYTESPTMTVQLL